MSQKDKQDRSEYEKLCQFILEEGFQLEGPVLYNKERHLYVALVSLVPGEEYVVIEPRILVGSQWFQVLEKVSGRMLVAEV